MRETFRILFFLALISFFRISNSDANTSIKNISRGQSIFLNESTPARGQGERPVCTFFSVVGLLEANLVAFDGFPKTTDLSEEWLVFVTMASHFKKTGKVTEYFSAGEVIRALYEYGMVDEKDWEYSSYRGRGKAPDLIDKRCAHLPGKSPDFALCSRAHADPALLFADAKEMVRGRSEDYEKFRELLQKGKEFRDRYLRRPGSAVSQTKLSNETAREFLDRQIPLVVDLPLYYGAWSHPYALQKKIPVNLGNGELGLVGYPEPGSDDREKSQVKDSVTGHFAAHSVVVLGYDDSRVMKFRQMTTLPERRQQTYQTKEYTGVYYFKNSWRGHGSSFALEKEKYVGYGVITRRYIDEMGTFYYLPGFAR